MRLRQMARTVWWNGPDLVATKAIRRKQVTVNGTTVNSPNMKIPTGAGWGWMVF